jgi:hypothetical protein
VFGESTVFVSLCDGRNELTRGPPELVQHFCLQGEFTSVQERFFT